MAFSPNGKQLATASFDKTAKLWRIPKRLFEQEFSNLQKNIWLSVGARHDDDGMLKAIDWKTWQRLRNEIH